MLMLKKKKEIFFYGYHFFLNWVRNRIEKGAKKTKNQIALFEIWVYFILSNH